jgi:hypothetical protein
MQKDPKGQELLKTLRLDAFADEPPSLFNAVAENMSLLRRLG